MKLRQLSDVDVSQKRVLIRFDGDVPHEEGKIVDDFRLKAVLPTIAYCRKSGARIVLMAHMGRPDGKGVGKLSNKILVPYLEKALGEQVDFHQPTDRLPRQLGPVTLLENVRFYAGEEKNDSRFAKQLAAWGDVYCDDAFAVIHRAHASTVGITKFLPSVAGMTVVKEVEALSQLRTHAEAPYVAILGGAKAADKSPVIFDLIDRADVIIVGGLVAITYLAAMGNPVGAHEIDDAQIKLARHCIRKASEEDVRLVYPVDFVSAQGKVKKIIDFTADDLMLDTGPASAVLFDKEIHRANTIFWNGAMGKFEDAAYAKGTIAIARSIAKSEADTRIASGGDTVSALHLHRLEKSFTFISTGGGATLEFIAGEDLPGLEVLQIK